MDPDRNDSNKINYIIENIQNVVKNGNLKEFENLIGIIHDIQDKSFLRTHNNTGIDLISIICKHKKKKLLSYLLYQSRILHYLPCDEKSKETAFYNAMSSNYFKLLEMLYDCWSGDLHWIGHKKEYDNFDVENFNFLSNLLRNAFNKYHDDIESNKKVNQHMIFNIESLIAFNAFQKDLYKKLNNLKDCLITWEDEPANIIRIKETKAIRNMMLTVLDAYENHPKIVEAEATKKRDVEYPYDLVKDTMGLNTSVWKKYFYITHEVYFRKLDCNMSLLILDNLHLLKLRLAMQNSYQKIESKLYLFNYHVTNQWSLYVPKKKKLKVNKSLGTYKGMPCLFTIEYNEKRLNDISNIIYLERRDFEKAVKTFRNELDKINIEENLRPPKSKLSNEDTNCLMLLPELRDDYSLKRISQHIAQLYSTKNLKEHAFLLIERTLQVVGEFLKSSCESLHLQPSTEALVKVEVSVEIINDLKTLRNPLCHAKKGQLLKRIELESNQNDILEKIRDELLYIKRKIDKVINIHKPFVERALIQNALSVISDRKNEMPEILSNTFLFMLELINPHDLRKCYEEIKAPFYSLMSLANEAWELLLLFIELQSKLKRTNKTIRNNITTKFPFFRKVIVDSLSKISVYKEQWQQIVNAINSIDPSITLLDYPNEVDANKIISFTKKRDLKDESLKQLAKDNTLCSYVENHWKFIINLLEFIDKADIFDDKIDDLKMTFFIYTFYRFDYKRNNANVIVKKCLDKIETQLNMGLPSVITQVPEISFIKNLTHELNVTNFLTSEERKYLKDNIEKTLIIVKRNNDKKKSKEIFITEIMNKITKDTAIPMTDYNRFIKLVKPDKRAQKALRNLVMGQTRDPLLPRCLKNRVALLREVTKNQTKNDLVILYKLDKIFRVTFEVLLFDIFVIMEDSKNDEILKKSSKLLTEINLRNILTHGSALLEVVGSVLDSNDLPTELVTKALHFIEDENSINALCLLMEADFDFTQINSDMLSPEKTALVNELKKSSKWKYYLHLIPEYKQSINNAQKKMVTVDEINTKLIEATCENDDSGILECIGKGANVNFMDKSKKAVIHHAAIKGCINSMTVLLEKGADVNTKNGKNNLTALHYSAMNGFKECVEFLLMKNADSLAIDNKGRTPVYLSNQRGHVAVSLILKRVMRKKINV